jgi:hypothetical protein
MKALIIPALAIASLAGVLSAAVDPQLIGLAMPDVKFLAGVYPDRLPASLQQFLLAPFPPAAAAEFQLFLAAPGLDPTNDIHEILFATVDPTQTIGLVMARGVFNVGQISDYLVSQGHTADVYNGVPVISSADGSVTIAFPDSSLVVVGAPADVMAAIDRGASPSQPDATLVAAANQVSATQDAWAVSIFKPDPPSDPSTPADIMLAALANVQLSSAGMTFGATAQFSVQARTDTAQNCIAMANIVRLVGSLGQDNLDPPFSQLLQSLTISAKGTILSLSLAIPGDQFQQMVAPRKSERKIPRKTADRK